jgi:hypothetical protein
MAIETTGGLRKFVAEAMEEVRNGKMDFDKANILVKMAGRVNESLFAEARIQKLLIENGESAGRLGTQPIGEPEEKKAKAAA